MTQFSLQSRLLALSDKIEALHGDALAGRASADRALVDEAAMLCAEIHALPAREQHEAASVMARMISQLEEIAELLGRKEG